jgi:hypothetical protein
LVGSSNSCGGVFEDELGIAFRRSWSNEIKLALRKFNERLLRGISEDQLPNYFRN